MPKHLLLAVAALGVLATSTPVRAEGQQAKLELTPVVGAFIPMGSGRQDLKDAPLAGAQLSYDLDPHVALVGTFSWVPTGAKGLGASDLDLFQYDLGLRFQHAFALGRAATLRPHASVGEGLRSIQYRSSTYGGSTDFVTFLSAGVEVGWRSLTTGITARYQLSSMDSPSRDHYAYQDLALFASVGVRL